MYALGQCVRARPAHTTCHLLSTWCTLYYTGAVARLQFHCLRWCALQCLKSTSRHCKKMKAISATQRTAARRSWLYIATWRRRMRNTAQQKMQWTAHVRAAPHSRQSQDARWLVPVTNRISSLRDVSMRFTTTQHCSCKCHRSTVGKHDK